MSDDRVNEAENYGQGAEFIFGVRCPECLETSHEEGLLEDGVTGLHITDGDPPSRTMTWICRECDHLWRPVAHVHGSNGWIKMGRADD